MTVFWDVEPCSLVEVYRRFRGACCIHHLTSYLEILALRVDVRTVSSLKINAKKVFSKLITQPRLCSKRIKKGAINGNNSGSYLLFEADARLNNI
jgi:hypothetical protein